MAPPNQALSAPNPAAERLALPVHGLTLVLGVGLLLLGLAAILVENRLHRAPGVIAYPIFASLLVTGACTMWLSWLSLRRSRAAWSFLLAICGTLTMALFFASPRFRAAFDLSWPMAMMASGVFAIATGLLVALAPRYRQ